MAAALLTPKDSEFSGLSPLTEESELGVRVGPADTLFGV